MAEWEAMVLPHLRHPGIEHFERVLFDGPVAVVVFQSANGTLLDRLAHPGVAVEPCGQTRERVVRVFVKQLLNALGYLHEREFAHLDLRPETILLQDDRLKLADFGQSRRLRNGVITGEVRGSPEFVSPEIVRGHALTLKTDIWSVGTLTYVLLTGISPFLGDHDAETLDNVEKAEVRFDLPEWEGISSAAKDFVASLLRKHPRDRPACPVALSHPWLEGELEDEPLPADCLREFKYRHKWLERRVFVQQTPSDQLLEELKAPSTSSSQSAAAGGRGRAQHADPRASTQRPPQVDKPQLDNAFDPPYDQRRNVDEFGRPVASIDAYLQQNIRPLQRGERIPLDQFGRLVRPEDLVRIPHDDYGRPLRKNQDPSPDPPVDRYGNPVDPRKLPNVDEFGRLIKEDPMTERRKLEPQSKGEAPAAASVAPRPRRLSAEEVLAQLENQPPIRLVRGEHREIEEEIANRILSDISEENSCAGSVASVDDIEPVLKQMRSRRSRSASSTLVERAGDEADDDDDSTESPEELTVKEGAPSSRLSGSDQNGNKENSVNGMPTLPSPLADPHLLSPSYPPPIEQNEVLQAAEQNPEIPVGAPLFVEGLDNQQLIIHTKESPIPLSGKRSPRSPRCTPGTKSPVIHSPGREHSMEVIIATKRGKPGFLSPGEYPPELDDEDAKSKDRHQQLKPATHDDDDDFKDRQKDLDKDRNKPKAFTDLMDLDKYRPKNFYKEDDDWDRCRGDDIDYSPWDSHYQIGPDTYLMATRGAAFNARVRDYRTQIFGSGAPMVRSGYLGYRNQDVTVRERRRYTDILRESQNNCAPKSNPHATATGQKSPSAALDRIRQDIELVAPSATKRQADGSFAPIFPRRLRDVYLMEKASVAVFECEVRGTPAPEIVWTFQDRLIENNPKFQTGFANGVARLTIRQPQSYDLGEYVCRAKNALGEDRSSSRLLSGQAPTRPGRPEMELSSDTELFMTWEPPEGPTYLEGIVYRLEYRLAGENDHGAPWIVVGDSVDDEAAVVKHLEPMGTYQFRVTARNGFGLGMPSLTSRIVRTHPRGAAKLHMDILRTECSLNVLSIPKSLPVSKMDGISEEDESEEQTAEQTEQALQMKTSSPEERWTMDRLMFRGRFCVQRVALDKKADGHAAGAMVKISSSEDSKEEFECLKKCQHENVVVLKEAYQNNGFTFLFTERLYEDVFSRFVFNDYYTEEQIAMVARQTVSALHWLHFNGIAHLTVTPHNIMLASKRSWIVKLVDFSNAQPIEGGAKIPADFSPFWAPPEFHLPETPLTVQADMWGVGTTVFCLLGGFHPFASEYDRVDEVKENVLNVKCDPNLVPVQASQEALSFVTWALKKSPLRRMRTDEGLTHRFLCSDPSVVRRRESIKYSSLRLRKTALLTKQNQQEPFNRALAQKYAQ